MSIEDIGYDVTGFRIYIVALATLQLYDYMLTLPDEIRCAWKGRNWVFYLFLFNRYVPIIYQFWSLFATFWVGYTQEVSSQCNHTAFIHMLVCVVLTLVVQVVLTIRLYAVTLKHKFVTGTFVAATLLQFGLGMFMTYLAANHTAHTVLGVYFPDGHLCVYWEHRIEEIAYTGFSLLFDLGAFAVILIRLVWRRPSSVRMPSIVQTIIQDATLYVFLLCAFRISFLCVSVLTAHLGHITRFSGNIVFVSIMTTRMLLSLKTCTENISQGWVLDATTECTLDAPPSTPRIIRGSARFSNPAFRAEIGNATTIPMEVIHVRDERCHRV